MPVDVARVDQVAAVVAAIYREAETALLHAITARLATGLDRPGWQASRLAAVNALRRQASSIVTSLAWTSSTEVRAAIAAAYRAGAHDAVRELAGRVAPALVAPEQLPGAAERRARNAVQALADAAVNEVRPVYAAILPQIETVYRRAIVGAAARKLTGTATVREAAQAAYSALVSRGITTYTDSRGTQWRLHTYVAMSVAAAVHRAALTGQTDEFRARGVRLVSVDDTRGECARCRPFEHRVLALWGLPGVQEVPHHRTGEPVTVDVVATLDQAMAAGLMHPNCSHTIREYLPGVSILLRQGRTADPAGNKARAKQRGIERELRRWRELEAAALTDQGRRAAAARIGALLDGMAQHVKAHGLTRQLYREAIGAGIIPPPGRVDDRAALIGIPRQLPFDGL